MSNLKESVKEFYILLDIGSDKDKLHFYKEYIASASTEFLNDETKENAYNVYSFFLDSYRINISGDRSFIDLLDVLRNYEENAAILSDKQRDHYIHSVNVFLLGLGIYAMNGNFRNSFESYISDKEKNFRIFETVHEEFFFRWGMSSLFHDIGYPVEIIYNQINKFIRFVSGGDKKGRAYAGPYLGYFNFDKINSIDNFLKDNFQIPEYIKKIDGENNINIAKPTDILSMSLSYTFKKDYNLIENTINGFLETMKNYRFVDHGFYSALIVLKWYGELTQQKHTLDKVMYSHILDSASSIFLHNAYKNVFMREPYSLNKLAAQTQPIAYLLILCDEAQEWNREAYGERTKQLISVDSTRLDISENKLNLHYITKKGVLNESFTEEKKTFINNLLDINKIFTDNLDITATTLSEKFIKDIASEKSNLYPRILIEYIEMMASNIHEKYNEKQRKAYPDKELDFPSWESLPETLKYSNIRQARDIVSKLDFIDCFLAENSDNLLVNTFTDKEIEFLSEVEHQLWVDERISTGWSYSEQKDTKEKKSPYIKPYNKLPEEIKDLDRDTIRNIIPLVREVGLSVFRK